MTDFHKFQWLARFFRVIIEKNIEWEITTMEEDGGAWDQCRHKRKTLELAIEAAWSQRKMDARLKSVLTYRDLNYPNESDAELGLVP